MSPFLFTVLKDCMSEEFWKEAQWHMMFVDDWSLVQKKWKKQNNCKSGAKVKDKGMRVNRQKTEYL